MHLSNQSVVSCVPVSNIILKYVERLSDHYSENKAEEVLRVTSDVCDLRMADSETMDLLLPSRPLSHWPVYQHHPVLKSKTPFSQPQQLCYREPDSSGGVDQEEIES